MVLAVALACWSGERGQGNLSEVRVICNGPGWVDRDSLLLTWCLEWTDPEGVPQRLLYGYGSGASPRRPPGRAPW
jgi:hypothetical protein